MTPTATMAGAAVVVGSRWGVVGSLWGVVVGSLCGAVVAGSGWGVVVAGSPCGAVVVGLGASGAGGFAAGVSIVTAFVWAMVGPLSPFMKTMT